MDTLTLTDIFRKSTSEIEVESQTIDGVNEITYLDDGRCIKQYVGAHSWYELYSKEGELLKRSENVPTALNYMFSRFVPVLDQKGTHIMHRTPSRILMLDVETGVDTLMTFDAGIKVEKCLFGDTIETVLAIKDDRKSILKIKYMRETEKWSVVSEFNVVGYANGTNIYHSFFDGFNTLFVSIYDGKKAPGETHAMYSVNINNGNIQWLLSKSSELTPLKMLTPSVLLMSEYRGDVWTFDTSNRTVKNLGKHPIAANNVTLDGRNYMIKNLRSISPDGRKLSMLVISNDEYVLAECILKNPLLHPILTHRYVGNWVRLMSDGTVESSTTWPEAGTTIHEVMKRVEEAKYLMLPVAILTAYPSIPFKQAEKAYLTSLIKAIAKEILK